MKIIKNLNERIIIRNPHTYLNISGGTSCPLSWMLLMYLFKLNCNFSSSLKRSCNLHKALKRSHCKTEKRPKTTNKRSMMYNVSYFQKDKLTFDGPCTTRYWAFYKICVLLDACHCIGGIGSMKYICAQICPGM